MHFCISCHHSGKNYHPLVQKIIIIGPAYPYRGGPARFNENMCRAFIQQSISCEIISFTLQYPSILFPGSSQYEQTQSSEFSFPVHRLINTINPISWIRTAKFINKQRPDAVIYRYWLPFFAPAFGSIIRLTNNSILNIALTDNVFPHEKRLGDHILNKYFLNTCDGFITMSEKVSNDLNTFHPDAPKLTLYHPLYENYPPPIPSHIARKQLNLPLHERLILFFGLIRPYKGLDILIEALAHPKLQQKTFKLIIAGEFYEAKDKYLQMIDTYQLHDKVILKDYFIPDDEVNLYFSACDAVIQPYKSATNSGVTMISYFYNKPIISTNVGGLKEVVQHLKTGWLCEPTAQSIAHAIEQFLNENNLIEFENHIAAYKSTFSWETFVHKIIHFITELKHKS